MLLSDFDFELLSDKHITTSFDSLDLDINEFLREDALNYQKALMANTYVFHLNNSVKAFFSILNDCLHDKGFENNIWNRFHRKQQISNNKRTKQYPAVKIGRLGVSKELHGTGLAYELMDFIKIFSIQNHIPACRLLILDAYNKQKQLNYYIKNDFIFLDYQNTNERTRLMYYDLIQLS